MRPKLIVLFAVMLALILFGCTESSDTPTPDTAPTPDAGSEQTETTSGVLAPAGLYDQPNGQVQALGTLSYRDAEGGFWAVVDTPLPEDAATAPVIAVIKPDDDIVSLLEPNEGAYVSIIGTRDDDRTYQAGPLIEGRTLEVVTDTVVQP